MISCNECFNKFRSEQSLEYHKNICIYFQYKNKYNNKISVKNIFNIVTIFNCINIKSNESILKEHILEKLKKKIESGHNSVFMNTYNNVLENELFYYNYYDILNIIHNITNIPINDISDIITTFNNCKKNITIKN